jgi:glutamate carboxypeptidase
MSQILRYLQAQNDAMVRQLGDWVNQNSPTYDKTAVDTMGLMLVQAFQQAGANLTATYPQSGLGDHYALTYGEGSSQILLLCHFDTVWPIDEAQKRPFTVENGHATGPGVHDMKAGILIGLFALKALNHFQMKPNYKLVWLLTGDEEIGSPTSREIIESEGRKSRYCLVLEGAHNQSVLTTARKGIGRFQLTVTGRAAHAGVEPQHGASAIEEMARNIQLLHALNDFERGITVNVGVISGGERPNIIADYAVADIDVRVDSMVDGEWVSQQIFGLQPQTPGCRLQVTGGITRPPFEASSAGLTLFEKAQTIAEDLGFQVKSYKSGGGSDGNLVAALGVPTLDGLGSLGGGAHALTEYTVIEALSFRAALLAELLMQL